MGPVNLRGPVPRQYSAMGRSLALLYLPDALDGQEKADLHEVVHHQQDEQKDSEPPQNPPPPDVQLLPFGCFLLTHGSTSGSGISTVMLSPNRS